MGSEAGSGRRCGESFAVYDPDTRSWKTYQLSVLGGLDAYSETWPRSGTMRNGTVSRRRPSVPLTSVTGSSFWPTPMGSERETRPKRYPRGNPNLAAKVKQWPTPTVSEAERGHGYQMSNGKAYPTLTGAVGAAPGPGGKYFPTPAAQDAKNSTPPPSQAGRDTIPGRLVDEGASGELNPTWVEWLMGFPLGWTDLEPSETP